METNALMGKNVARLIADGWEADGTGRGQESEMDGQLSRSL